MVRLSTMDYVFEELLGDEFLNIESIRGEGVTFANCNHLIDCIFDFNGNEYKPADYCNYRNRVLFTEDDYIVVCNSSAPEVYLNARGFLKLLNNTPSPKAKTMLNDINEGWFSAALLAEIDI
jgi:hypothetical protein